MSERSLDLDDFSDLIERPHGGLRQEAEERRALTGLPPRALGRLEDVGEWLGSAQARVPVRPVARPRLMVFAGDHGIAELGVSTRQPGSAAELVRALLDGTSPAGILARQFEVPVRVVDMALDCDPGTLPAEVTRHRVRRSSGRLDTEDALNPRGGRGGVPHGDGARRRGSRRRDRPGGARRPERRRHHRGRATLIAALCGTDASVVTGRGGGGIDDLTWMRKCAAVRDGLRRARPVLGDQLRLLAGGSAAPT